MIIRVDKCSTFGMRKLCTKPLPKLLINGVLIPYVEMGKSFLTKVASLTSTCLTTNTCVNCPLLYKSL